MLIVKRARESASSNVRCECVCVCVRTREEEELTRDKRKKKNNQSERKRERRVKELPIIFFFSPLSLSHSSVYFAMMICIVQMSKCTLTATRKKKVIRCFVELSHQLEEKNLLESDIEEIM